MPTNIEAGTIEAGTEVDVNAFGEATSVIKQQPSVVVQQSEEMHSQGETSSVSTDALQVRGLEADKKPNILVKAWNAIVKAFKAVFVNLPQWIWGHTVGKIANTKAPGEDYGQSKRSGSLANKTTSQVGRLTGDAANAAGLGSNSIDDQDSEVNPTGTDNTV